MQTFTKYFWQTLVFSLLCISSTFGQVNADFSATPTSGCTPAFIQFTDLSTASAGNIVSWSWQLGGTNSTIQNPGKVFTTGGNYTICLTVTDNQGNTDTECKTNYINLFESPQAQFNITPTTGCSPLAVQFTDNSTVGSSPISSYQWTFGDGNSASGTSVNNLYTEGGNYDVILTVTDLNGCQDTITFNDTIRVYDVYPAISADQQSCQNESISFTDSSTTSDGTITNWFWEFGNGQTSTLQNPTVTYAYQDSFDVKLTTTNSFGCVKTVIENDFMIISQPNVDFTTLDTFVCVGQEVTFTDLSNGNGRPILSYLWNFGDGNTSTAQNPTHQYSAEGFYTVCLTVTDTSGCDSVYCIPNIVQAISPQADFAGDSLNATCPILVTQFSDSSFNAVSWNWDFGDGIGNSTNQNPSYTYINSGQFDVTLIVTDINGCQDTLTRPNYVSINGPYGNFSATPLSVCPNTPVTYTANAFNTTRYIWDFGDGNLVINQSNDTTNIQSYTYTSGGTYFPSLTIEDTQGCLEIIPATMPIVVNNLNATIAATDTSICDTTTITFTPTFISNLPIDTFYWDFGGIVPNSTDTMPSVFFSTPGVYPVTLHYSDSNCTNFTTLDIVVGRNPQASFTALPPVSCNPQLINFQNTSTNINSFTGDNISTWNWDFDYQGFSDTLENPTFTYTDSGFYDIQLIVGTSAGCFDTTTAQIRINLTPNANAGPDKVICLQNSITLNGSGIGTYQWTNGSTLDNDTIAAPTAMPTQTTDYILTVTSPEGCTDSDTVTVTVLQMVAQQVSTSPDTTICEGDVIQIFGFGSSDVLQYEWNQNQAGLSCYQSCNNPFASPTTTTTYYVTLFTTPTCYDTDSITITVVNEDQNILGQDVTICAGDSFQLNASIGTNPIFSPSENISCVLCPNPYVFPATTKDYIVQTTTATGCKIQDTITINIFDTTLVSAGENIGTCIGNSVQLQGFGTGIINWIGDNTISDPTIINPTVTPIVTTDYYLSVQNGNCIILDTVTVLLVDGADLDDGEFTICANDATQIGVEGFAANYSWSPGIGLSDSTTKRPLTTLTESTVYTVTGTIPGCPSDAATVTVNVIDVTSILPTPSQNVFEGQPTPIILTDDASNPNLEFLWSPNLGISCVNCNTPLVTLSSNQVYTVQITDLENGCIGTDSVELSIISSCNEDLVIVPNAFSPNNDGLNDQLFVRGSTLNFIYTFKVYSRSGELVFETQNLSEGWDGTHKGKELNTGVYVYYVEAPCALNGNVILKTGNVLLIR